MNGKAINNTGKEAIIVNDEPIHDEQQKANAFAQQFAQVSSNANYEQKFAALKKEIEETCSIKPETEQEDQDMDMDFTYDELTSAINKIKLGKAPGPDNITPEMITHLPLLARFQLLRLFNQIWKTGQLPDIWKTATVIPILKAGKKAQDLNSYRPIALTCVTCKLMERLVANRLNWLFESKGILTNKQAGFRKNRSTLDPIMELQDKILKQLANSKYTLAVFVDIEKAYDMVWRHGLLMKMAKYGIKGRTLKFIANFLSNRQIRARIGNTLSDIVNVENGMPQGALLSPMAFITMMNDLPEEVENKTKTQTTATSLYADDTMLAATGSNKGILTNTMQKSIDQLVQWCDKWGFRISPMKTVAVMFSNDGKDHKLIPLVIKGKQIAYSKSAKFLGVIFDNRLNWIEHIDYLVGRCNQRINLMKSLKGSQWGANRQSLLTVYRALIRSIIDYGAPAYDSASQNQLNRLQVIQAKALRLATGAMNGTATAALQIECQERPFHLRRLEQQAMYAVRIDTTINHPSKHCLELHWTISYGKYHGNRKPLQQKVHEIITEIKDRLHIDTIDTIPNWTIKHPQVDLT